MECVVEKHVKYYDGVVVEEVVVVVVIIIVVVVVVWGKKRNNNSLRFCYAIQVMSSHVISLQKKLFLCKLYDTGVFALDFILHKRPRRRRRRRRRRLLLLSFFPSLLSLSILPEPSGSSFFLSVKLNSTFYFLLSSMLNTFSSFKSFPRKVSFTLLLLSIEIQS